MHDLCSCSRCAICLGLHRCLGLLRHVGHAIGWLQGSLHLTSCHPWAVCREWKNLLAKGILRSSGPSWAAYFMFMVQDSLPLQRGGFWQGRQAPSGWPALFYTPGKTSGGVVTLKAPTLEPGPALQQQLKVLLQDQRTYLPRCLLDLVSPVRRHAGDQSFDLSGEDGRITEVLISLC